jgi:hypothetical protein
MNASAPETDDLLERAAELRAAGNSWDATAAQLDADPDDLQGMSGQLPSQFFGSDGEAPLGQCG